MKTLLSISTFLVCLLIGKANATVFVVDCLGGGTHNTIQSAVNVSGPGDTIVVRGFICSYPESVMIQGAERLHLIGTQSNPDIGAYADGAFAMTNPPTRVTGFTSGGNCFTVTNSRYVTIAGFFLAGCQGNGVQVEGSSMVQIQGNRIAMNQGMGILDVSNQTMVTGNYIHHNQHGGIYLEGSKFTIIKDNEITNNVKMGLFMYAFYAQVINNRFDNNMDYGLYLGGGEENRLERNTLSNHTAWNMYLDNGAIRTDYVGNNYAGSIQDSSVLPEFSDNM